jgi:hypothetical protein
LPTISTGDRGMTASQALLGSLSTVMLRKVALQVIPR